MSATKVGLVLLVIASTCFAGWALYGAVEASTYGRPAWIQAVAGGLQALVAVLLLAVALKANEGAVSLEAATKNVAEAVRDLKLLSAATWSASITPASLTLSGDSPTVFLDNHGGGGAIQLEVEVRRIPEVDDASAGRWHTPEGNYLRPGATNVRIHLAAGTPPKPCWDDDLTRSAQALLKEPDHGTPSPYACGVAVRWRNSRTGSSVRVAWITVGNGSLNTGDGYEFVELVSGSLSD